jgi:hypothetical protein
VTLRLKVFLSCLPDLFMLSRAVNRTGNDEREESKGNACEYE